MNTLFAEKVHSVVRSISKGETMSYAAVANAAGYPGAARAVGTLMKANHDPAIPCHRVICSDGSVGQYNRGGSLAKERLLESERSH